MKIRDLFTILCLIISLQSTAQKSDWHSIERKEFTGRDLISPMSFPYRMDEFKRQLQFDLDNDGEEESILFIDGFVGDNEAWGIEFRKGWIQEQYLFTDKCEANDIIDLQFEVSLHDFDNDNIPEIIVTYSDDPEFILNGKIFKICGSGVNIRDSNAYELRGWLREVGTFSTFRGMWHADGNLLYTTSQTGNTDGIVQVYINSELKNISY
ncbi:MAG: hypothetical protein J1F20_06205 [Muribaculaceae bacterium]|nr:hypothetical protein [Muribaculaceae bacterium]